MIKKLKQFGFAILLSSLIISCSDDDSDDFVACAAEAESGYVTQVSEEKSDVYTSIVINATPNQVWEVLTDFEKMPNWSSTFKGLEGDVRDGGQINALFLTQGQVIGFPHALIYDEGVSYGWSDEIITIPGIVDNHFYTIENCGSEVLFVQTDEFTGNNENIPAFGLANAVLEGYQTFNKELKEEVERRFN
ncbi:SRPBCC family protein [Aureivirga sp. CE67]|uniref:SRPBCC family protein n=1 Tax=Aureivirga sp. CE67 TaxID=1788983 RepID=UPI0018CACA3D|nr:SRPBCC family protein [Aureivirga sp. CE67]